MKNYMQKLCDYVRENKITFEEDCLQPCLDALWWHYSEFYSQDSEIAKEGRRSLESHLEALPFLDSDAIFTDVGGLCAEYERMAFSAGLCLGVQMMLEMQNHWQELKT